MYATPKPFFQKSSPTQRRLAGGERNQNVVLQKYKAPHFRGNACIANKTRAGAWPPKPEDVRKMYSHDLNDRIKQANLASDLDAALKRNPSFAGHWGTVKEWSEQKHYEISNQKEASALIIAITASGDGRFRGRRQACWRVIVRRSY